MHSAIGALSRHDGAVKALSRSSPQAYQSVICLGLRQDEVSKEEAVVSNSGAGSGAGAGVGAGAASSGGASAEVASAAKSVLAGRVAAGEVGLGAAVALSQAAAAATGEVDDATKLMIRQTAEWFHANPDKSKVRPWCF